MPIDFQREKERHRLENYIESDLGHPPIRGRGPNATFKTWYCPFHSESSPSFTVNTKTQTWRCFGSCGIGGDIYHYIQMRNFGRIEFGPNQLQLEAYKILTNEPITCAPPVKQKSNGHYTPQSLTIDQVRRYHDLREPTMKFFNGRRKLSEGIIDDHLLGTKENYSYHYEWADGKKTAFPHRRFVIPYFWGNEAFYANHRRDDDGCLHLIAELNHDMLDRIRLEVIKHLGRLPTDRELLDHIFGSKYRFWFGSDRRSAVFGVNRLYRRDESGEFIRNHDGTMTPERMHYVLVHESEIAAMTTEDLGYPSVAINWRSDADFAAMFQGVFTPVIFADNDGGKGLNIATRLHKAIGNPLAQIVYPPAPFKDVNDAVVAGDSQSVVDLLDNLKLTPLLAVA